MAGNYWQSSQYRQWMLDKQTLDKERKDDIDRLGEEDYTKVMIFYANIIQTIGEKCGTRQQVIASATTYFKRFYSQYSLGDCDPLLLAPTCIFLAAKVEESGVISNSRLISAVSTMCKSPSFAYAFPSDFPYRIQQVWECEFFLLELMDCCLILYHPYRPLMQYVQDMPRANNILPLAWRIVNDSYRTDVILLYPPSMIALACIHIAYVVNNDMESAKQWFADISVDMEMVMEITRIILKLYELWKSYNEKDEIPAILEKIPKVNLNAPPEDVDTRRIKSEPIMNN